MAYDFVMTEREPIKEQILNAALKLMNSMGYGALTISELARQAEITKQRLYYHYPELVEILISLAERWSLTGQACALEALARSNDSGAMKILAISEGMFDWMAQFSELSRLALVIYQTGPQVKRLNSFMDNARSTARERIRHFLVQDKAFKNLSKSKLENAVTSIHSLLYGFCLYVTASNDFDNLNQHRENCREALTRLIRSY